MTEQLPRRALWFNPFAGVAGDMFVGALLDLGADIGGIRDGLALLGVEGLEISIETVKRSGIAATKYRVAGPHGGPGHRHWSDIAGAIEDAGLPDPVTARSLACSAGFSKPKRRCTDRRSRRSFFTRREDGTRWRTWSARVSASTTSA